MALLLLALVVQVDLVKQGKVLIVFSMHYFEYVLLEYVCSAALVFLICFFNSVVLKLSRKGGICYWLYRYINGELPSWG